MLLPQWRNTEQNGFRMNISAEFEHFGTGGQLVRAQVRPGRKFIRNFGHPASYQRRRCGYASQYANSGPEAEPMNLYFVMLVIAVVTAGLAALIVHVDLDLWAIEKFQDLNSRPLTLPRNEPPVPLEPAVVRYEPATAPMRVREMSEGERWMASMGSYAPGSRSYRALDAEPAERSEVGGNSQDRWQFRMPEAS
jgi:hypothetical protein